MKQLADCRLYVITGENYHAGRGMLEVMEAAILGGADLIQLRDKHSSHEELLDKARALRELTRRYGVLFIVNDHPAIALASDADGVHLGQADLPIGEARQWMGKHRMIGISTHHIGQARAAAAAGADYIGVGPVYPTGTKPDRAAVTTAYVAEAAAEIAIPFFAIGGIHEGNADAVLRAGARRLCAVSAIVGSPNPAHAARALRSTIQPWLAAEKELAPMGMGETPMRMGEVTSSDGGIAIGGVPATGGPCPESASLYLTVNGRQVQLRISTLLELAEHFGIGHKRVIAEQNGCVVSRAEWQNTALAEGDNIEFIHFVGGG